MPAVRVFDLDHPQVGVARHRALDIGVGLRFRHRLPGKCGEPREAPGGVARLCEHAASRPLEPQFEKDRTAMRVAPPRHRGGNGFGGAAAQMGHDPQFGGQAVAQWAASGSLRGGAPHPRSIPRTPDEIAPRDMALA